MAAGPRVGARSALAAIVLVGFLALCRLPHSSSRHRASSRTRSSTARPAASLGEGDGLRLRGEPYELRAAVPGAPRPGLCALRRSRPGLRRREGDQRAALRAGRRPRVSSSRGGCSPERSSLGVAALAVLVPSSMLTSLVMTETLAYLAAAWLLYAIALALERPTVTRQFAVLAGTVVAYAARPQLAALYGTYLAAIPLSWLFLPGRSSSRWTRAGARALAHGPLARRRRRGRRDAARDRVVAARCLRGALALVRPARSWHAGSSTTWPTSSSTSPSCPSRSAPIALAMLVRRGRAGVAPAAAFAALFLTANVIGLLVVAVFASTRVRLRPAARPQHLLPRAALARAARRLARGRSAASAAGAGRRGAPRPRCCRSRFPSATCPRRSASTS